MTVTKQRLTFEEYLTYDDGTDTRYELVRGELVLIGIGSGLHGAIAKFLEQVFDAAITKLERQWTAQRGAVGVRSPRAGRWDTSRIPDVVVMPQDQWELLRHREAVIELNESAPLLVVEIVSESTKTEDYRHKRAEYNVLEIAEYWIVDPLAMQVTICALEEGLYEAAVFMGSDPITSQIFPELQLTAEQILTATS